MSNPPHVRPPFRTPAGTRSQSASPADERAAALRDVMDHAVKMQREVTAATPMRRSRVPRIVTLLSCIVLIAFSAYSLIARPVFIWGEPPRMDPAHTDASTRLGMYLLAQRVEEFRAEAGEYPASLGDIGEAVEGVRYTLVSDSVFELRSTVDTTLVLRSDAAVEPFLGNSIERIQRPGVR